MLQIGSVLESTTAIVASLDAATGPEGTKGRLELETYCPVLRSAADAGSLGALTLLRGPKRILLRKSERNTT